MGHHELWVTKSLSSPPAAKPRPSRRCSRCTGWGRVEVFPPAKTIAMELDAQQQADLLVFMKAIDGTTDQLHSEGDEFRDALRSQVPPCPKP